MGLLSGNAAAFKSIDRTNFTATAGQTTFNITQGYSVGDIDVFLNGVKLLEGDDYFATNGTTVVLTSAAAVGDMVQIASYNQFSAANTYTKTESDNKYMVANGQTPMGSYLRTPNYGISSWSDSSSASLEASVGAGTQGAAIKVHGRSVATFGGDIHYVTDTRGAGGGHKFYGWDGTSASLIASLDASGRFSTPNRPFFLAKAAQTIPYNPGANNPILFNTVVTNIGNCYNPANGAFTAPVSGVYQFNYHLLSTSDAADGDVRVWVNGVNYTIAAYGGSYTGYKPVDMHFSIKLNANDYVQLRNLNGQTWHTDTSYHCWATGVLIG